MEIATRNLGKLSYEETWRIQLELLEARALEQIPDTLLVVEHPAVITYGRKSPEIKSENEIKEIQGVPVFAVERGGEATFHGPGQIVMYPIFSLNAKAGPKGLLRMMEEAIIQVLLDYGIESYWIEGKTGVWLKDSRAQERKIASLGIAVRKGVSYHGLALNVSTHLPYFKLINPCGFASEVMTNMKEVLGKEVDLREVAQKLEKHVKDGFVKMKMDLA